jgi:hypothetical protein
MGVVLVVLNDVLPKMGLDEILAEHVQVVPLSVVAHNQLHPLHAWHCRLRDRPGASS